MSAKNNKEDKLSTSESIDKCEDNEEDISHQNNNKLDEFKDNNAGISHQK